MYGDRNGDRKVDADETDELNPNAVGLAINNADFALALLTPKDPGDTARYTALRATSNSVKFVGTDVFDFNAQQILVELSLGRSEGTDVPVIDFSALNNGAGYSIDTGSGTPQIIKFDSRRIHASADDVLVSVSQFVYLKGNFALDMGSQETVTIRTGIPSSIGGLAGSAVDAVNAALSNLSTTLNDLKSDVQDAIASALQSIQAKINAQVDSIVDTIFANLTSTLEEAVGAVSSSLTTQLEAATAGVSQSIDGAIDAALAPITAKFQRRSTNWSSCCSSRSRK